MTKKFISYFCVFEHSLCWILVHAKLPKRSWQSFYARGTDSWEEHVLHIMCACVCVRVYIHTL